MFAKSILLGVIVAALSGTVSFAQSYDDQVIILRDSQRMRKQLEQGLGLEQGAEPRQPEEQTGNQPQPQARSRPDWATRDDPYANYPTLRGCGRAWGYPDECERARNRIDEDCSMGRYCKRQ